MTRSPNSPLPSLSFQQACRPVTARVSSGSRLVPHNSRRASSRKAPTPHDLRRTWIGDVLDLGVDLPTASTTGRTIGVTTLCNADPLPSSTCPTNVSQED
jgi:hypothetical protein